MLKRNSINVHLNTITARTANSALVKSENRLAVSKGAEELFLTLIFGCS